MVRQHRLFLVAVLLTLVAYRGVTRAEYVYEDEREGAVTARYPPASAAEWRDTLIPRPRMLANVTWRLQAAFGAESRGYHLANLGMHLTNGTLLYGLLLSIASIEAAAVVAGLWLLHPLQVETVAYVAARPDLLLIASVLVLLTATRVPGWRGVALATVAGGLAVLAKETGVVVVGLLPLWLAWRGQWRRAWAIPVAVWAVAGIAAYLRFMIGGEIDGHRIWNAISLYTLPAAHGPFWSVAVQWAAILRLAALVVWPQGFTVDHDWDLVTPNVALAALLVAVSGGLLVWRARHRVPGLAFACGWLVIALGPRFLMRLPDFVNEHQFPIALIGACLALAPALDGWLDRTAEAVA